MNCIQQGSARSRRGSVKRGGGRVGGTAYSVCICVWAANSLAKKKKRKIEKGTAMNCSPEEGGREGFEQAQQQQQQLCSALLLGVRMCPTLIQRRDGRPDHCAEKPGARRRAVVVRVGLFLCAKKNVYMYICIYVCMYICVCACVTNRLVKVCDKAISIRKYVFLHICVCIHAFPL